MRKIPKQARSQQKVDALLDAAAALFQSHGYEATTTNEIAAHAGVSIGTLYQFFDDKDAMLGALVERYVGALRAFNETMLAPTSLEGLSLDAIISRLIDNIAAFEAHHAGFQTLFMNTGLSHQVAQATAALHETVVAQVETVMASHYPALTDDQRHLCAIVSIALVKGLMALPGRPDFVAVPLALHEVKAALLAYIRDYMVRAGVA